MPIIEEMSDKHGIPEEIIRAVIQAESGGNPYAIRYEDHYRWFHNVDNYTRLQSRDTEEVAQKTSWGLMQIMGAVARELGYDKPFLAGLCDIRTNLEYGCEFLAQKYYQYKSWEDALAAYNAGSVRLQGEQYVNQSYVDRITELAQGPPSWEWEREFEAGPVSGCSFEMLAQILRELTIKEE